MVCRRRRMLPLLGLGVLLASGYGLWQADSLPALGGEHPSHRLWLSEEHLRSGDLVFRRTSSLEGRAVRQMESSTEFTHVGVVWIDEQGASVIHASPDSVGSKSEGGVVSEPLSAFLSTDGIEAASVYRLHNLDDAQARQMAEATLKWLHRPFDLNFELDRPQAFHCTELVWHAVSSLGVRDSPPLLRLHGLPGDMRVLTLGALMESLGLVWIQDAQTA